MTFVLGLVLSPPIFAENPKDLSSKAAGCVFNGDLPELRLGPADGVEEIAAFRCMRFLEDPGGRLDFDGARAILDGRTPPDADLKVASRFRSPPAPGQSPSVFWLRLSLRVIAGPPRPLYLVIERARLGQVDLYRLTGEGVFERERGGDQVLPADQPYTYRYPVFVIQPPAPGRAAVYYLRVYSPQAFVTLPLALRTNEGQRIAEIYETAALGAYFGIVAVMFIYNAILFVTLRIRAYLFYILYMAAFAGAILIYQGVFPLLLSPAGFSALQPYNGRLMLLSVHVAGVFGVYFVHAFLHTGHNDFMDRLGPYVGAGMVLMLGVHLYAPLLNVLHRPMFVFFFVGLPVLGIGFGLYRLLRRQIVGSYFLTAWGVVLVALTGLFLEHHGLIPYGTFGRQGILLGSAVEMTLLSIGLADHFRRIEVEGARARAASRAKTSFLANMSHEIRTPLNAILGMSDLLVEGRLGETERGYVKILRRAGQGLLSLINDILDFSKIESGKMEVERTAFDLFELVESTVEIMAPAAVESGIDCKLRLDPDLPRRVMGDPLRLRQVLLNLISNAVKFTKQGGIEVDVAFAKEPDRVRYRIRDTGIGIAEDKLRHIFDTFAQADESTTRRYGGTGLGLAISYSLVELMGGELGVRSAPKKGSDFWFSLPLFPATPDSPTVVDGDGVSVDRRAPFAARPIIESAALKILLAEDNSDNQMLFRALLKKFPYEIEIAENGRVAVQLARQRNFDLIFMDIQMPEMDGLEATRRIRELQKNKRLVPIYALSAHATREDAARSLAAGCDGHLTKPINRARLLEVIARVASPSGENSGDGAPAT